MEQVVMPIRILQWITEKSLPCKHLLYRLFYLQTLSKT